MSLELSACLWYTAQAKASESDCSQVFGRPALGGGAAVQFILASSLLLELGLLFRTGSSDAHAKTNLLE